MSVESCSPLSFSDEQSVEESMGDHESCSNLASPAEKVPCQICRLQNSAVIYFNVPVCSGCRAFFRRSVKKGKSYQCLNSRLCGKNFLVPNRRVCKYCRFNRCVKAGMLDAKLRLQNRLSDLSRSQQQPSQSNENFLNPTNLSQISGTSSILPQNDILAQMNLLKQHIRLQRSQLYGSTQTKESPSAAHDIEVGLNEYVIFNQVISSTKNIFSPIDSDDWNTLSIFEYSMWWSIIEQAQLTVRNFGHDLQRSYNLDGSYSSLDGENAHIHWQCIYPLIDPTNRDLIYDALVKYTSGLQIQMTNSVGVALAKAQLDEVELSALLLLLMTRPACMEIVKSETSQNYLKSLRNQVLDNLANHLKANGRNVDERMGQIIFLTSDFQNLGRLIKHSVKLLMTATNFRAAPKEFLGFFEQQLQFYSKYAVF